MWQDIKMMNAASSALLALVVLALFGSALWWLAQRPMFTFKAIRIQGADLQLRHVNPLTVRGTALPRIRGNFFTANLETVRTAFETVPWVRRAMVRREWPNQLIVTLEEHAVLGTWGDDGKLISVKGDVFTANLDEAEEDGTLLNFGGPDGSEKEVLTRFQDMRAWFAPIGLTPETLHLSERYAWIVKLSTGVTIELGREQTRTTLKERVERLVSVYPQLVARLQNRIERVDMRYPNGIAMRASGMTLGPSVKKNK
ncbi:MAG: cell division protein FtsQ/DivIB [Burkholderiaceae bacterium]